MNDMAGLNARQQRFVDEYCIDLNATQAAIRAGYSKNTAEVQASRLLRNVKIAEAIEAKRKRLEVKAEVSAEWVLKELVDNVKVAKESGDLNPANKALELIGKHLGMFTDKVKMDMQGEVNHSYEYYIEERITTDPEAAELLKQLWQRQANTA